MRVRHIAAIVGIALSLAAARPAPAVNFVRHQSVWLQTPTSITIAWQTDANTTGKILYGLTAALGSEASHAGTATDHAVGLSGLTPSSKYYYRVVSGTDTLTDGTDSFRTAPATNEPFRFLAFGDIGRATPEQIQVAARIDSLNADLGILTGDIIYEGGEAANFTPQYFDIYRKTIARIPFYSSLGNHDVVTANGQPYLDAYYFPTANSGTERYYSFDYSNAHFVSIEVTLENIAPNSTMLAWLASDLAATNKQWKIVFFHVPMYSNLGVHGDDPTIAAALGPIFDTHGVDLVFQGHNHYYTRTYPIAAGAPVDQLQEPAYMNPKGTIYIVTGGGGRGLYALAGSPVYEAYSLSAFHVTVVDVTTNTLGVQAIARDGSVIDAMTLTKDTPTAVAIVEFFADSRPEGVHLQWRVSAESDAVGFHVYRGSTLADVSTRLTTAPLSGGPDYSFSDGTAEPGRRYYYALGAIDGQGREERMGLVTGTRGGPYRFAAMRTRPNPSDGLAEIGYTLDRTSEVRVSIYDVAGRVVRGLRPQSQLGPGPHTVRWDGTDRSGRPVPAGQYFARIQSEHRSVWTKILRVR
jgi:3',5'-cyclic AMP phosphodiesterase CpdA